MNRSFIPLALAASLALACGPKTSKTYGPESPVPPATLTPDSPGEVSFPDEAFRAKQPEAGQPRAFQLPDIKRFQIGKNKDLIDVYLVERHDLPTISMEFDFDGGSMTDPKNKVGLASVCADMMTEGTKSLEKIAFNEALADLASGVASYADTDSQVVVMYTLTKHFDKTFALFIDSLLKPGMRKADFERLIDRRLDGLKQARGSADQVASRLRGQIRYGSGHAFGRISSEKGYKAITIGDCNSYQKRWIRPRGARLFVVGDVTEAQVKAAFEPVLATWRGAQPRLPKLAAADKLIRPKGRVFFVDVPGSAQTNITMIHPGPSRKSDDFFATTLAASVLGGGFSGRMNMNLREDKGYSYGARGGFTYNKWYGFFGAGASVRADSTYQSTLELLGETRNLQNGNKPASEEEIEREKMGRILALPAQFSTMRSVLGQYRTLVYYGLPFDYWNKYVANIEAVSAEQIAKAASTHLAPDQAVYLIVGDGNAKQKVHVKDEKGEGKDVPMVNGEGKELTLRESLEKLLDEGTLGKGALVTMDADGAVKDRRAPVAAKKAGVPAKEK